LFENYKKNHWIKKTAKLLRNNISNAEYYLGVLQYRRQQPMAEFRSDTYGGISCIKLTTLSGKETTFFSSGLQTTEFRIKFYLNELFKLSRLNKNNLMSKEELIKYLFYLNEDINLTEKLVDEAIINIVDTYNNNIKKIPEKNRFSIIETIERNVDFPAFEESYNKKLSKLNYFLKFFKKHIDDTDFHIYNDKLNNRKWIVMYDKIQFRINEKHNEFDNILKKKLFNNPILDFQFSYDTIEKFIKAEKLSDSTFKKVKQGFLDLIYIKSVYKEEVSSPSVLVNNFYNFLSSSKDEITLSEYNDLIVNKADLEMITETHDLEMSLIKERPILKLIELLHKENMEYIPIFNIDYEEYIPEGYKYKIRISKDNVVLDYIQIKNIPEPIIDQEGYTSSYSSSSSSVSSSNALLSTIMLSAVG